MTAWSIFYESFWSVMGFLRQSKSFCTWALSIWSYFSVWINLWSWWVWRLWTTLSNDLWPKSCIYKVCVTTLLILHGYSCLKSSEQLLQLQSAKLTGGESFSRCSPEGPHKCIRSALNCSHTQTPSPAAARPLSQSTAAAGPKFGGRRRPRGAAEGRARPLLLCRLV